MVLLVAIYIKLKNNFMNVFLNTTNKLILSLLIFCCCSSNIEEQVKNDDAIINPNSSDYSILFVGNSLTYYNNLPNLVKELAKEKGVKIQTTMLAKGNYAIIDHLNDGQFQTLMNSNKFDFVVIQQGPSSQQDGYDMLVNDGKKYAEICKTYGSKLAYFMVWPSKRYYATFDGVIANYTAGAKKNNAILCPVGKIWKEHFDSTNDFSYYGPDEFHPSLKGSKKAAEIILNSLLKI